MRTTGHNIQTFDMPRIQEHLTIAMKTTGHKRAIIYKCGGICGGWGDRLRGIVTLFYTAFMLDADFSVILDKPKQSNFFFPALTQFAGQSAEL